MKRLVSSVDHNEIENYLYQMYDNYRDEGFSETDIADMIVEHMEDMNGRLSGIDRSIIYQYVADHYNDYTWNRGVI